MKLLRQSPLRVALAGATAVLLTATAAMAGNASTAQDSSGEARGGRSHLDHIFVIMMENHSKTSIIDNPHTPYFTQLAHTYGMADHYYGVTHPSMPNYVAAISGDNFSIQDDEDENVTNLGARNLVDQLQSHHKSWAAYMDTLPADKLDRFGPVVDGSTVKLYAKKHNPFVLFDDVKNNSARMSHIKPYDALANDLAGPHAPDFVWITPNQCHDMHGGVTVSVPGHPETPCPYAGTKDDANDIALKQKGDEFLRHAVETITHSPAWKQNSAIFVVTDENDYAGTPGSQEFGGWESAEHCCDSPYVVAHDKRLNPDWPTSTTDSTWPGGIYGGGLIPAVVVTSHGPRHVVSHTPYNHYSLLRTVEDNWSLGHLRLSGDTGGGVIPMTDLLGSTY